MEIHRMLLPWPAGTKCICGRHCRHFKTRLRGSLYNLSLLHFSSVHRVQQDHMWCRRLHTGVNECNCLDRGVDGSSNVTDKQLDDFDKTADALNDVLERLTLDFNLRRPDFAVINVVALKGQAIPSG